MSRSLYRGWKPLLLLLRRSRTGSGSLLHRGWKPLLHRSYTAPTTVLDWVLRWCRRLLPCRRRRVVPARPGLVGLDLESEGDGVNRGVDDGIELMVVG